MTPYKAESRTVDFVDCCCVAGGCGVSARANDSAARHVRGSIAVWVSGGGCAIAELENA